MALTADQKKRYARHIALAEIGEAGQEALLESSVLVIGAGGLGSPVLQSLTAAGVGYIAVVDSDRVELSNLHRQTLYRDSDVGKKKTECASAMLSAMNSDVHIKAYQVRLDNKNATEIMSGYDLIIDGCDNFPTRFLVNKICVEQQTPLISGAVNEWQGQVAVFEGYKKNSPCYQCFCPKEPPRDGQPGCSAGGMTGALTAAIGNLMAMMALKQLLGIGTDDVGKLVRYNALGTLIKSGSIRKDIHCTVCA